MVPHSIQPTPYVIAVVEIDEPRDTLRLLGGLWETPPEIVHLNMLVEPVFVPVNDVLTLPFWRPVQRRHVIACESPVR